MNLSCVVVNLRLSLPWATARTVEPGGLKTSAVVHVALRDETGCVGFGEAAPISRYRESAITVLQFLNGFDANALATDHLEDATATIAAAGPGHASARCALECALLDLAGKQMGRPVFELLQLAAPVPQQVSYTIGIGPPEQVREHARSARRFGVLKLKLGGPFDREAFQAVREIAPEKQIRIDANEGWSSRDHALKMIEWLAKDPGVELAEQPLAAAAPEEDHRWLFDRSPLPLFADESCHRSADIPRLAGLFHGVNVKLMKTGGLIEAVRTLNLARQLGLQTMLGCMIESSLGIAAAFHLGSLADHLDLDSHMLLVDDPFSGLRMDEGTLDFEGSHRPGLGVWSNAGPVGCENGR